MKMFLVAGARPNFMKIAPLVRELRDNRDAKAFSWKIVHTGQHYDYDMSSVFFENFDLPAPDYFLNAGSGTHAEQTAKVMVEFEKICFQQKPDLVMVVGDVNSTLACSVTAKKLQIRVAHVEAGLRSGDMTMPEEINRIVTDSLSDYLFVSERSGLVNLRNEGKVEQHMHLVGNIMIDTLHYCIRKLDGSVRKEKSGPRSYAVVTLHRPSNVDDRERLADILAALTVISKDMEVFFPIHPRTEKNIKTFGFQHTLEESRIRIMPPLSYLEFLALWKDSSLVLTDSGGLQEETTALGIPCFTIRENTERPITIVEGTNVLVGTTSKGILKEYERFRSGMAKQGSIPELWDGKTASRIIDILSLESAGRV